MKYLMAGIGAMLGVWITIAGYGAAAKSDRFTVNQTYIVVWSCFPIPNGQPCYTEELTVKAIHEDGWLDVIDELEVRLNGTSNLYTVNPGQMMAFSPKKAERVARR